MSDDEVYKRVMRGAQGDNPEHKRNLKRDKAKAKAVAKGMKARKDRGKKFPGEDGPIDTGMFS
jgi:hypothetical protein